MDKADYILRSLSSRSKTWENLLIGRIFHRINDLEIEFVCQQYVRRGESGRALTDLYFPQLLIHLEIDEMHHSSELESDKDQLRMQDIIDATNHRIERIKLFAQIGTDGPTPRLLPDVLDDADKFADVIIAEREEQKSNGTFVPWNFDERYEAKKYLDIGYLDIEDGPAFRNHRDALQCFGYQGGHFQRAVWKIKDGSGRDVWFPKLYENENWNNELSDDGCLITMEPKTDWARTKIGRNYNPVVVFAHSKDALGRTLYRFIGLFEFTESQQKDKFCFKKTADRVAIVRPLP